MTSSDLASSQISSQTTSGEPASEPAPTSETTNLDLSLDAYDYQLPEAQIAQNPVVPRDSSKLLVVEKAPAYQHRIFQELPQLLRPGDLLVMNDTRVIPARLYGHKLNGTPVEVLLLEEQTPTQWLALVKPGKRLKVGAVIQFGEPVGEPKQPSLTATVLAIDEPTGGRILQFDLPAQQSVLPLLSQLGQVPLPPYITSSEADPEQYQTVYADRAGSAAAPTAGLHFTPELLERLKQQGIEQAFLTLHVGVGTFRPVEASNITQHQMHGEWIEVPPETVARVEQTKAKGGRVIAVGTTSVRSLEGAAQANSNQLGQLQPFCGKTNLYIYPGYQWRVVDGMITNFHLPKSSLMMLVSALIGRQRLLDLYQVAIEQEYRFYSFGDAMLILPEANIAQA
jgi:S-adenosylmethionine:tRNA ribosyltransferase-isomerase